ncbi:butyryl-CoA dehydrogenase [Candidatus Magnetomorum sp. HK-1]|nr:butyryl-CoA dehydrogenase [Candidatus Magnetomorum sp. HK-1]
MQLQILLKERKRAMKIELTQTQEKHKEIFKSFIDKEIFPYADDFDKEQSIPGETIQQIAKQGWFGATIPKSFGGLELDTISWGLLCEEIGRASSSLLSLVTVHYMLCQAINIWGTDAQKNHWLPKLAKGEKLGAFALTEPEIGSDAKNVGTSASLSGNSFVLNGKKKWISCGQIADVFLIIAQADGEPCAFLLEKNMPGFEIKPINDMLGFRAAMLAELHINDCIVPESNLVGKVGFGFSHVAGAALDSGRYTIAWGCIGLGQACKESSISYAENRKQFGTYLKDHQMIQQMIADMITNLNAARLLCYNAGYLKSIRDPQMIMATSIAKYFASKMAAKASTDAVQIHGANGCSSLYPVQRYMRDAKIMEIIEGSNQMQQSLIAKYGFMGF